MGLTVASSEDGEVSTAAMVQPPIDDSTNEMVDIPLNSPVKENLKNATPTKQDTLIPTEVKTCDSVALLRRSLPPCQAFKAIQH